MNKRNIVIIAVIVVGAIMIWKRGGSEVSATDTTAGKGAQVEVLVPATFSQEARMGEAAFNAVCAACHGANAAGSDVGPPLVHKLYEPSHHGDYAFEMAAASGSRAHHWQFGNMPPVKGVTKADVRTIIAYVRELQRANGID